MLQNDRDNLELDKLQVETRKFMAEENKLRQEAFWYPFAVGARLVTAFVAVMVRVSPCNFLKSFIITSASFG
jgi:hypothetical protein